MTHRKDDMSELKSCPLHVKIEDTIILVQQSLSPELLRGRWRKQSMPLEGHCYVAAEALWHLLGKDEYQPYYAKYVDEGGRATHWWLVHKKTGLFADPTKEQYLPDKPPYDIGRRATFLTLSPSKRAKVVIDRVNKCLNYSH